MNKYLLNTFFLIVLSIIIILLPYPINAEDNYIIDNDVVYIDDENVYLSAKPHTIYESGYVYFNLTSKNYNGNIDVAFGFNTSLVKPKKAELYNLNTKTWNDFPLSFTLLTHSYKNCDKWFYIKDVPIISNKNYNVRVWLEIPISTNINKGKYLFAVKPSFETIQQSIDNNRLYILDPWFNTSFTDRQKIIITTNGSTIPKNYQILLNVTYNSSMQNDFSDLRFTNLTNDSLSYWIESKINSEYANIWINFSNEIIHPNSDIIYMYYGNDIVNNKSNGYDVFETFTNTSDDWSSGATNYEGRIRLFDSSSSTIFFILPSIYDNNQIVEMKYFVHLTTGTQGQQYLRMAMTEDISNRFALHELYTGNQYKGYDGGVSTQYWDEAPNDIDLIAKSVLRKTVLKTDYYMYQNSIEKGNDLNNEYNLGNPTNMTSLYFWAGSSNAYCDIRIKYIFIRKYIENEPTILFNITEYYTTSLYYNLSSNYNHTIESDGTIIVNRSLSEIDNTYWSAKSTDITYWIFTKEINNSGYTNFTIENDNLNNFSVKLKQYSYYNLNNSSLVNTFTTNQYGTANIDINLIPDDYYIIFINQSLTPPPIKPLYPIQGILIFKDDLCINNINKIIVYKNNSYSGIYNYSDEIAYLNNTDYTFFINYDNIDIINSENFLITFFKNYGYILISIISLIVIFGICIYFYNKVKR